MVRIQRADATKALAWLDFDMPLPSFIVIGPGKTGTTWLYQCLKEHPEIALASGTKETLFFNRYYDKGLGWYEDFFAGLDGAKAIGEVSNDYFYSEDAPARIAKDLPNVKLITLLRNPLDRIKSIYQWSMRNGNFRRHGHLTFEESLNVVSAMKSTNHYKIYLDNYLRYFPREQIFVGLYDDIKARPDILVSDIYRWIGVDPEFRPPSLEARVLPASQARFGKDLSYARRIGRWLRERELHGLLTWAKINPWVLRILTKPISDKLEIAEPTRQSLRKEYEPDVKFVEQLVGRNLDSWK